MNKKITITIESPNGQNKQISSFGPNKVEHITNTKQWEYVLNEIILSYDNANKTKLDNIQHKEVSQQKLSNPYPQCIKQYQNP